MCENREIILDDINLRFIIIEIRIDYQEIKQNAKKDADNR